ncbi:MAG TPA: glycosyl hydrolase, partial [Flavitalea sp.]|nr:glycosyl hydrolase [Flavitalea sp.]
MKLIASIATITIQYLFATHLFFLTALLFLLSGNNISFAQDFTAYEKLKAGFQKPTGTSLPKVYWWWINGNMDTVRMKEELLNIKKAGIGGVDILEIGFRPDGVMPAGPAFMGPESLKAIGAAIREATKLGLEVGLNLSSSWNAGGTWITPEHSAKSLYRSSITVKGGDQNIRVPFPEISKTDKNGKPLRIDFAPDGKPVYRKEIAVLAIPVGQSQQLRDTTAILNLTSLFDEKTEVLNWKVPAGDWMIHRYVCSSSGEELKLPSPHSAGPIIDHFDSAATEVHFMYFINKLKPLLGDFSKTALKNFYLASFEATGTVWTPSLADVFKHMHGYDIAKFLPYLFDKGAFDSLTGAAFKKDYDHTISELMINNHYRKGREIANRYGLKLISESGGPGPPLHNVPVESMKALGALDVPRGEFWINHSRMDGRTYSIDLLMLVKEIAAASHIYGRKITELESFTSFQNWQEGPGDMRPIGDRAFCEGMNRVVVHGFTHNPSGIGYPGIVYAAGTHYNDKTTWWSKVRPFNEYLSRISYVLQETDFVADAVYYYGDKVPNFATPKNTRFAAGSGYDYEIINTEILLRDLSVAGGVLSLPGGARFKVLALGEIAAENKKVWD